MEPRPGDFDAPVEDHPTTRVTVVVITNNRRAELARTLTTLVELPERPPVVVVDNGSVDGTARMVQCRYPQVRLIEAGSNLGAAGRNVAMAGVDTPYVAFCDDDMWWDRGSLARAAHVLDTHPEVAVITARIVLEPSGTDDPINDDMRNSPLPRPHDSPGYPLISFLAGASVVRRAAVQAAGAFSARLGVGGEEELLSWDLADAGWSLLYVPACVCHHQPSPQRDPTERRRLGVRNALWTAWLRRPVRKAFARSVRILRVAPKDVVTLSAVLDAARGAGWVRHERRLLGTEVERRVSSFDRCQFRTGNRSYR